MILVLPSSADAPSKVAFRVTVDDTTSFSDMEAANNNFSSADLKMEDKSFCLISFDSGISDEGG